MTQTITTTNFILLLSCLVKSSVCVCVCVWYDSFPHPPRSWTHQTDFADNKASYFHRPQLADHFQPLRPLRRLHFLALSNTRLVAPMFE